MHSGSKSSRRRKSAGVREGLIIGREVGGRQESQIIYRGGDSGSYWDGEDWGKGRRKTEESTLCRLH